MNAHTCTSPEQLILVIDVERKDNTEIHFRSATNVTSQPGTLLNAITKFPIRKLLF